jgi:hypothetical protein
VSSPANYFNLRERAFRFAKSFVEPPPQKANPSPVDGCLQRVRKLVDQGTGLARRALDASGPLDQAADRGLCMPLIHTLVHLRAAHAEGALFAFTSASAREGVSYVVDSIAWELAHRTGERVLTATALSLSGLVETHFREDAAEVYPEEAGGMSKVWRLVPASCDQDLQPPNPHTQSVGLLRRWFGYILVEYPSLQKESPPVEISKVSDGVVLIVAAGQTTRAQIMEAQSLLELRSCNVLGLVLNKRTQPLPAFLHRYL